MRRSMHALKRQRLDAAIKRFGEEARFRSRPLRP
jgi:hypothetical protein